MSIDISDLIAERKRLVARVFEIDKIMRKLEKENREKKLQELLAAPTDAEDKNYRFALENYSKFEILLGDTLFVISSQLNDNCVNSILDEILYTYSSKSNFLNWLHGVIFNQIWDYSRKSDGESYLFDYKYKIERFFPQ